LDFESFVKFCEVLKPSREKRASGQLSADGLIDFLIYNCKKVPWAHHDEETCTKKRGGEFTAKKVVAVVVTTGMSSM
jgi:hypothetical protein